MTSPLERLTDWLADQVRFSLEQSSAVGTKLASWLVLGNAGALVITFNAIVTAENVDKYILTNSAFLFTSGLILSFIGISISYLSSLLTVRFLSRAWESSITVLNSEHLIEKLEAQGIEVPQDNPLHEPLTAAQENLSAAQSKLVPIWWLVGAALLFQAAAATSFSAGVLAPAFALRAAMADAEVRSDTP